MGYKYGYRVNKRRASEGAIELHPLAEAFINNYSITENNYKNYINAWALGITGNLPGVNSLYNFVAKLDLLLPIVPKSMTVVRGDLLTASSVDAPTGGWVLSNSGLESNGINTSWNLPVNPFNDFVDEKYGFGVYNTKNLSGLNPSVSNYVLLALGTKASGIALNYTNGSISYFGISDDVLASVADTTGLGSRFACRPTNSTMRIGVDGVANQVNVGSVGANPNSNFNAGYYGFGYANVRFASIYVVNQSLTLDEIVKFQAVDNYCQSILGRNTYPI